jgi:hypothetical protein
MKKVTFGKFTESLSIQERVLTSRTKEIKLDGELDGKKFIKT